MDTRNLIKRAKFQYSQTRHKRCIDAQLRKRGIDILALKTSQLKKLPLLTEDHLDKIKSSFEWPEENHLIKIMTDAANVRIKKLEI